MLIALPGLSAARIIFAVALATIIGAWIFEYFGYLPCELCLKQRWAYYAAIPLALLVAVAAPAHGSLSRLGLFVLLAIWLASTVFGVYHAGVEWKWWAGPSSCTGGGDLTGLPDLTKPIIMCDEPSIRILGLSLAGWNALISLGLAVVAFAGTRSQGSSSVSQ